MAEKIISPGVFTNEIDQTFLPAAVADIGAALIGPTVKGPAGIPTVVTSYSDFQAKFGDVFKSGSDSVQFLTSHAAEEYLKNSDTLTVVRVMDGTFGNATAVISSSVVTGAGFASSSIKIGGELRLGSQPSSSAHQLKINDVDFVLVTSASLFNANDTEKFVEIGGGSGSIAINLRNAINNASNTRVSASVGTSGTSLAFDVLILSASVAGTAGNIAVRTSSVAGNSERVFGATGSNAAGVFDLAGGVSGNPGSDKSFTLRTIADGTIMNNADSTATTSSILTSGSIHNIRHEVSNVNTAKGTFTLLIRAGNDNIKRKQVLETFTGVNLDPNSTNFIGRVVGDQRQTVRSDGSTKYLELTGSFPNKSRFVTVESINKTIDYLDENGKIRLNSFSGSLPNAGSGSLNGGFSGATDGVSGFDSLGNFKGTATQPINFYETISTQTQGFSPTDLTTANGGAAYSEALDLLSNQDEFDINLVLLPGLVHSEHKAITNKAIDMCEDRGDCFAIIDPVVYAKNPADAVTQAEAVDSNFAAMYYPWIKVSDTRVAGAQRWVPPSVVLGGIYAFNDRVAHPWFAPAGLNRGGITTAIQAQRKLTQANRDTLYDSNVNPIATFPGQGVTVFGQKTLQKKNSALDRINVRRLLIRVKKFIASSSRFLVFEQNTAATRRRFLGIVNPFLENVQSQSGLSAFRVVMDETNNTPDTIDRNQLVGQLFLQPTRTAEFIVLDFTIQPTGASFPE